MRRIVLMIVVLALLLMGCAPEVKVTSSMEPSSVLLTVNGKDLMTVGDLKNKMIEYEVSRDFYKSAVPAEKDVFLAEAEYRILAYMAADMGCADADDSLSEQYDDHMEEIKDTEVYGTMYAYTIALKNALGMSDDAFKKWNLHENMLSVNMENLLDDIGDAHPDITDPTLMNETVMDEIYELAGTYTIKISYPGLEDHKMTYEVASNEGKEYTSEAEAQ